MGRRLVKITVDTNVLVRAVLQDDPDQGAAAAKILKEAAFIAIAIPCLCELVWVLQRGAKLSRVEIAETLQDLLNAENVVLNRPAVESGLAFLLAGGDFADGVIAFEGLWLGGETYVSFDKKAVGLMESKGYKSILMS
jgi:predicted nucleic-acid-binding protein